MYLEDVISGPCPFFLVSVWNLRACCALCRNCLVCWLFILCPRTSAQGYGRTMTALTPRVCLLNCRMVFRGLFDSAKCPHAPIYRAFWQRSVSPCPYVGGFFGSAKCPQAHIWGAFWQHKLSPCPYMGGFLTAQTVPMPIYTRQISRILKLINSEEVARLKLLVRGK